MRVNLEVNKWNRTDDSQWLKYLGYENDTYKFEVVDYVVFTNDTNSYCSFRLVEVSISKDDLNDDYLEEFISCYYENLEEVLDTYGDDSIQIIAEIIAETKMMNDEYTKELFGFEIPFENMEANINEKCDYVEKYLNSNL